MKKLLTVPQYAKLKGISRQGVFNSKPHNSKLIELPMFVEFEGQKIEIEKRKFIIEMIP